MKLKMAKAKRKPGRPKVTVERKPMKVKRTRKITEEQREALRQRMVEMRKKRKPAEYKNIHHTVLSKPENDKLSMKNVKGWNKEAKEDAAAHAKNARGRGITPQIQQREMAMSESKKAYVRQMEHYLRTGDWIAQFMGAKENELTQWKCLAMAYNADGTPKRTIGVWYPDIRMTWTKEMEDGNFEFDNDQEVSYDETISITDTNFRENESNLIA
jgi:hypothetical protein